MNRYIDYNEQRRREREVDLPRRLQELTPEASAHWIRVLDRAEPLARAESPARPCHYGPWASALSKIAGIDAEWPVLGRYNYVPTQHGESPAQALMNFAEDVSAPGWPQEHAHLVDFAIRFLDADVMLFRSGYTKRHLLRRLQQATLSELQADHARLLAERAVVEGTGLEEYREFCRLAARVWTDTFGARLTALSERAIPPDNRVKVNARRMLRRVRAIRKSRGEET